MSVIQASSAGVKDMADGSLRITFEFDPRFAKEAYSLFGARGTACAIAALTLAASTAAAQKETQEPKEKPGQLCVMACTFCADKEFQRWMGIDTEEEAKALILEDCKIISRKELDSNYEAGQTFLNVYRGPFLAYKSSLARPK